VQKTPTLGAVLAFRFTLAAGGFLTSSSAETGNQVASSGVSATSRGVFGFMAETKAERWRKLAADTLAEAAVAKDDLVRWTLTQIAVGYDHLAKRAESTGPMAPKD
jgi:hypothetical protein